MDFTLSQQDPSASLEGLPDISSGLSTPLSPLTPLPDLSAVLSDSAPAISNDSVSGLGIASVGSLGPASPDFASLSPVKQELPSPPSSDSESDSDDEPAKTTVLTSRNKMSADKKYCDLTVTEGHTKPPSLGQGRLGRDVGVEFRDACEAYFLTKEVPDDKKVIKILGSFKDFKHKQWIKLKRTELVKNTWEDFIDSFLDRWTEKHWDMNLSDKLSTFAQGTAHFYEWAQDYRAQAAHLTGTPYEMDEKHVKDQISALMDPRLRLRTKADPKFTAIKDFDDWLDAVNDEYELYMADLHAAAEFLRAQQADSQPYKKQKLSHNTNTASSTASTSIPLADANTNRRHCPSLTKEERTLLENNRGCFNCREFFVNHRRDTCKTFPAAAGYKTLTQADVDAKKAKMAAEAKTKTTVAAASVTEVSDEDRSVEIHTVAATMGQMVKLADEADGYQSEDSYVSPLSCPSLPWSALAFGPVSRAAPAWAWPFDASVALFV
ncbi:hypothetical protein MD484_g8995, partial [Candolleomyces efflorescens]